jgi:hypothetical protein
MPEEINVFSMGYGNQLLKDAAAAALNRSSFRNSPISVRQRTDLSGHSA